MSTVMARFEDGTACEVLSIGAHMYLVRYSVLGHEAITWEPKEDIELLTEEEEVYEMC